ncbi:hypothetical protein B0H19DRAFT_1155074 [Mycena capillaripes]|nr:hypothetical protein B0H19DRAFT_1155074 [Mycena capillaripes]
MAAAVGDTYPALTFLTRVAPAFGVELAGLALILVRRDTEMGVRSEDAAVRTLVPAPADEVDVEVHGDEEGERGELDNLDVDPGEVEILDADVEGARTEREVYAILLMLFAGFCCCSCIDVEVDVDVVGVGIVGTVAIDVVAGALGATRRPDIVRALLAAVLLAVLLVPFGGMLLGADADKLDALAAGMIVLGRRKLERGGGSGATDIWTPPCAYTADGIRTSNWLPWSPRRSLGY